MALSSDGTNLPINGQDSPVMFYDNKFSDSDDDDNDDEIINGDDDNDESVDDNDDDVDIMRQSTDGKPLSRRLELNELVTSPGGDTEPQEPSFHANGLVDNVTVEQHEDKKETTVNLGMQEADSQTSVYSDINHLEPSMEPNSTVAADITTSSNPFTTTEDQVMFVPDTRSKMSRSAASSPCSQLEDYTMGGYPLKFDKNNSGIFFSNWTLNDEDMSCLPFKKSNTFTTNSQPSRSSGMTSKRKSIKLSKYAGTGYYSTRYGRTMSLNMSPYAMIARKAKSKGYDFASFLETAEFTGISEIFPCMQCYENYGSGGMEEVFGEGKSVTNGKCQRCGGQVQTLASYCVMLRKMKGIIMEKDLIPHDVYPDGNCLFAAVIDQLRINNNFSFSLHSLRLESVEYIRKNPYVEDGTPIVMFLTDESLESYLDKMSQDGVWGDHIILSAIANVICMPIFIYGGLSGDNITTVYPCNDNSDNENINRKICLGHIGEAHYFSLRPRKWTEELNYELIQNEMEAKETKYPIQYLNFVFRHLFHMNILSKSEHSDPFSMYAFDDNADEKDFDMTAIGPAVCNLVPERTEKDSWEVDISDLFSLGKTEDIVKLDSMKFICMTPKDSEVVSSSDTSGSFDLVVHTLSSIGIVQLVPTVPHLWEGQTITSDEGMVYLKNIDISGLQKTFRYLTGGDLPDAPSNKQIIFGFKTKWPCVADAWSTRNRRYDFPNLQTRLSIIDNGCDVISLTDGIKMSEYIDDHQDVNDLELHWCYSFARADKEICHLLSSDQRHCYILFRSLASLLPSNHMLPVAIFKTIFFYSCENIPESEWSTKPAECFFLMLKKLVNGLKDMFIPHYFMSDKNMLESIPEATIHENLKVLTIAKYQPVVALYYLLDSLKITSSEVCRYVEEMLSNICYIDTTNDQQNEQAIQACSTLISSCISQLKYKNAMQVLSSLLGDTDQSSEQFINMLDKKMWDVSMVEKWCFYLYVDIRQKTTYTKYLCKDADAIPITEVFGPDCTEEIPDTVIPELFSVEKGNVLFMDTAYKTLEECLSSKVLSRCLKFYLKKYSALAGDALILPATGILDFVCSHHPVCPSKQLVLSGIISTLYYQLFYGYYTRGMHEEFREMLPAYELINACCDSPKEKRYLYYVLMTLGEKKKASAIKSEMGDDDMMGRSIITIAL